MKYYIENKFDGLPFPTVSMTVNLKEKKFYRITGHFLIR